MKFTLEELLKVIETSPEKKTRKKRKAGEHKVEYRHIDRFIEDMGIKAGTTRVPTYVVYYYYRQKWKAVTTALKIRYDPFFKCFKQKFTRVRSGIQRYYLLEGSSFDLSREGKLEAKHYARQYQNQVQGFKKARQRKVQKLTKGYPIES